MKYTAMLILAGCLQVSATAFSQKVSLHARNTRLETLFRQIKDQTGYNFLYKNEVLSKARPVTVVINAQPLETALDVLFKDQDELTYDILDKTILVKKRKEEGSLNFEEIRSKVFSFSPFLNGNMKNRMDAVLEEKIREVKSMEATVRGTVKDEKGEALPGVSILIKGTQQGTTSDVSGSFILKLQDENAVLVFSFVGYASQEITVGGRSVLDIAMKTDTKALNEVVVVGYTSKQLTQLSSSVSVVSAKELTEVTSNNVVNLLQGKAPGVVVSNSSGDPTVAPSIVIRGSSSISAGSDPLYVVDGIIGGSANPTDIESVTILKDAAATGLYGSRASNGVIIITTKSGKAGVTKINLSSTVGFTNVTRGNFTLMDSRQLYDYQKSFYPADQFASLRPDSLLNTNTNWQDLAFRTGIALNQTLSMSGGSEKTQFYVAGNYYKEDGTLRHNGINKYTLRTNLTHKLSDKFSLAFRFNGSVQQATNDASGGYGALYGAYTNMPWDPAYKKDGTITTGNEKGWIGRENDNFMYGWQFNSNDGRQSNINTDLDLTYQILPSLTLSTHNRISLANSKSVLYYDVRSRPGVGLGLLYEGIVFSRGLITSNRLRYEKTFGQHSLSAIVVAEAEKNYQDVNNLYGTNIPAGLKVLDAAAVIQRQTGTTPGNISENAFSKGLIQADYSFSNRYFFVGSFINESSSRFGANKRSAGFYTLAGSWILSNEGFMRDQQLFDFLKTRVSYGLTGNANIGNYQTLGLYSLAYQYAGNNAAIPYQLANNDLTWEKAKTFNAGLDIGFLKNFNLNLDWYDKTTQALLLEVPLAYTSGYTSVFQNIGSIKNKGLEVNLTMKLINKKDFKWEANINVAFNRNKVLKLNEGKDITSGNRRISVGRDLYSWYLRKWAGVDPANGDPLWEKITTDTDGKQTVSTTNQYNDATLQFAGTASPDFTGGFHTSLRYKGFSLTGFLNFVSGGTVLNSARAAFDNDGALTNYNSMVLYGDWNRWEKPGDIATHPKPVVGGNKNAHQISTRYMENGSYIRLRNVTLGYDLPESIVKNLRIFNVRIFVSGDNLWTGTRFSGMDPEVSLSPGGTGTIGTSNTKYPVGRKMLVGINVGF